MKSERITLRMPPDDVARLRQQAEADGCTVSESVRARVAGRRARPRRSMRQTELAELARVLAAVGRIGGNANQLARAANRGGAVDAAAVEGLRRELEQWRDQLVQVLPEKP